VQVCYWVLLCLSDNVVVCGGMSVADVSIPLTSGNSTVAVIVVVFIAIDIVIIHTPGKLISILGANCWKEQKREGGGG